jgi:hypothetical protein
MLAQKIVNQEEYATTEMPTAKVVHEIKIPMATLFILGAALIGGILLLGQQRR